MKITLMLVLTLYLTKFFTEYISEPGKGADMKVFAIFGESLSTGAKWLALLIIDIILTKNSMKGKNSM